MDSSNKEALRDFREQCTIYLVGDEDAPKTNRWLAMTNDPQQVEVLMAELGATRTKSVFVRPKGDK
jgi:hypothetical protein